MPISFPEDSFGPELKSLVRALSTWTGNHCINVPMFLKTSEGYTESMLQHLFPSAIKQ